MARDLPRVSGLMVQVPVDGVAMPVSEVVLTEPRGPAMSRGLERAAEGFETDNADRSAAAGALTATRIRAGDPAIIGLIVRAAPEQLREVARLPDVRAVEALPADAVWGRFAVRPLQPQFSTTASPLPDTAPIPTR